MTVEIRESNVRTTTQAKFDEVEHVKIQIIAYVITADTAKQVVDIEIMKKVGQMIEAGEPKFCLEGEESYWKVPLVVVPPEGDTHTYPTGKYALVDALSGDYVLDLESIGELKATSTPLIEKLYPDTQEWIQQVKALRKK